MRRVITAMGVLLAVVTTSGLVGSSALAQSPWWHLVSESLPSHLPPGAARDEVQEVKLNATGGDVSWLEPAALEKGVLEFAIFPYNASHEEVQIALEGLYGAGNVEVSGGPPEGRSQSVVTELEPYVVTFKGNLGDRRVQPPPAEDFGFAGFLDPTAESLEGAGIVTEKTRGRTTGEIVLTATNLGEAEANGCTKSKVAGSGKYANAACTEEANPGMGEYEQTPVSIADELPAGLEAVSITGTAAAGTPRSEPLDCSLELLSCTFTGRTPPFQPITVVIEVEDVGAKTGEVNEASISGGRARRVAITQPITIGETTPFGVSGYELVNENQGGAPDTQAGSHPFQQTTTITLNQTLNSRGTPEAAQIVKDLHVKWPAGLIGNPTPIPQCALTQFLSAASCPSKTAVGVANVLVTEHNAAFGGPPMLLYVAAPVFNLVPSLGEPARFGFTVLGPIYIDPSVRSGEDYGVTVSSQNITQISPLLAVQVTVWGVPGDSSHDNVRGSGCLFAETNGSAGPCEAMGIQHPPAFLSLPTSCTGSLQSEVYGDSWVEPKPTSQQPLLASYEMPQLDGCGALPFHPQIKVTPDGVEASRPTGLNVDVHVPQEESLNAQGLAVSDPRNITVALPEGVAINPAAADGLQACSEGLVGFEGFRELATQPGSTAIFTPKLPGSFGSEEALQPGVNFCPNASKIGTVTIKTPILPNPLTGAVYLASQNENPFGSLVAMYLIAEDPVSGVLIKLAGQVHLSEAGQIVATFENSPQAPFEDAELHFFGGERAPLVTPAHCGPYTTTSAFTQWSAEPGEAPHAASSTFDIASGPNDSSCPGTSLPFSPSLHASSSNIQTGAFSPFAMTMSREDGQQNLKAVQLHMPGGLLGTLSSVELCPEPQADRGTCGPNSLIGETIVSVGLGGDPFSVRGGRVYITGPYRGAPFGLSIVNPAKAGPFDLGQVVVRAKIEVDPITAALTVTTDSDGPYEIPQIIDGIPLQIKHVNVTINRPDFTFNPTNCDPMAIKALLMSGEGSTDGLSVPFQVTNCATLAFKPRFKVSTVGKTSRANGASLDVRLAYPKAAWGSQANIRSVKVDLPKQLPSRLTTLQKACPDGVFNQNPASCPAASRVGTASATTPIIPVALSGPAYFVSHGGAKFPELVIALSGYGVTVYLHGETFINKAGITSSTFRTIPDVPIGSFELKLPQGPGSALAANGRLCAGKLTMPTAFTAQNGATIKQSTPIAVTGCTKHTKKKAHKARRRGRRTREGK